MAFPGVSEGHEVIAFSRQPEIVARWFPKIASFYADFASSQDPEFWKKHLKNVDVLINCVGVFQTSTKNEMWLIHVEAPKLIYSLAQVCSVSKIIHISALGIEGNDSNYAKSKLAIEDYLRELSIDSIILRPSFVYGRGSYGGSSFLRGAAGLPGFILTPGAGQQQLQPIFIEEFERILLRCLSLSGKHQLDVVGSEKLSLKNLLQKMRSWLGFGKAFNISIPIRILSFLSIFGNFFRNSPISTTGLKILCQDNISTPENYQKLIATSGISPSGFSEILIKTPSQVQDRWHARLFFLRPLLRLSLAFLWIFTAMITAFFYPTEKSLQLLEQVGLNAFFSSLALYGSCLVDFALGLATLFNYKIKWVGLLQCVLILGYTLIISIKMPYFWLYPFGPISKNVPILLATGIMMALESSR